MTWEDANKNTQVLISKIEATLEKNSPKNIIDVIEAVSEIDPDCRVLPNPNGEGQYCQVVLYPSSKWNGFPQCSFSISKYNLYR